MQIDEHWRELALAPPRAHGRPLGMARLRSRTEDFEVDEVLGFEPDGRGPHLLLQVRKIDANTQWVARQLALRAGVRPTDVGYAGLKDRRAVATQWFTVPALGTSAADWLHYEQQAFRVVAAYAHGRKLPRGALRANRFRIVLREVHSTEGRVDASGIAARIAAIARRGVPNYFGPQRFGRDCANLGAAVRGVLTTRRAHRGFEISAARSLLFNAVLAERVRNDSWATLVVGDLANLDERGSVFPVAVIDEPLLRRLATFQIHPTGPLWGTAAGGSGSAPAGEVAALESDCALALAPVTALLAALQMPPERRALRLAVRALACHVQSDVVTLEFSLRSGSFATAVVRELFDTSTPRDPDA